MGLMYVFITAFFLHQSDDPPLSKLKHQVVDHLTLQKMTILYMQEFCVTILGCLFTFASCALSVCCCIRKGQRSISHETETNGDTVHCFMLQTSSQCPNHTPSPSPTTQHHQSLTVLALPLSPPDFQRKLSRSLRKRLLTDRKRPDPRKSVRLLKHKVNVEMIGEKKRKEK